MHIHIVLMTSDDHSLLKHQDCILDFVSLSFKQKAVNLYSSVSVQIYWNSIIFSFLWFLIFHDRWNQVSKLVKKLYAQ